LFYGGLIFGGLLLLLALGIFLGVRYGMSIIERYTDTAPMTLPVVKVSDEELGRIRERLAAFGRALDENRPVGPLRISSRDVNALIQNDPALKELNGRAYVTFTNGEIRAQVSLPGDLLGLRPLRGRYLNASGVFRVVVRDGQLWVTADSLSAKGNPLPNAFMKQIRGQNLAENYVQEPGTRRTLGRLKDISVEGDSLVVVPANAP